MNTERLVTSLGLAQKLEKAGYPQDDSLYYWCEERERQGGKVTGIRLYNWEIRFHRIHNAPDLKTYAAPLAGEIMELLPTWVRPKGPGFLDVPHWLTVEKEPTEVEWGVKYGIGDVFGDEKYKKKILYQTGKTPAEAAGLMYAYLYENGLLK